MIAIQRNSSLSAEPFMLQDVPKQSKFEAVKQKMSQAWQAAKKTILSSWGFFTSLFFRVLDIIHPSISPKIQTIYLKIVNKWNDFKAQWHIQELKDSLEKTQIQNRDFAAQIQWLREDSQKIRGENQGLLQAQTDLREKNEDLERKKGFVLQERDQFKAQYEHFKILKETAEERLLFAQQDRQLVVQQREIHASRLEPTLQENQGLATQIAALRAQLQLYEGENALLRASMQRQRPKGHLMLTQDQVGLVCRLLEGPETLQKQLKVIV